MSIFQNYFKKVCAVSAAVTQERERVCRSIVVICSALTRDVLGRVLCGINSLVSLVTLQMYVAVKGYP